MAQALNPRLTAAGGPLQGQTFALDEPEIGIGRESTNLIVVEDPAVSRRHCVIRRREDGRVAIADLNSRNGTFVNGLPASERVLEEGDEIRLGKSLFVYQALENLSDSQGSVQFGREPAHTCMLFELRRQDTLYLKPQKLLEAPVVPARFARGLVALVRISAGIQVAHGSGELAQQLLVLTLEAIPAERGAILLFEPGAGEEPSWTYVWDRDGGPGGTLNADRPIVQQARREGIAILSNAPGACVLAAPFLSHDETIGVLYLDSSDPRVCFDQEHLQLAAAIGGISGMAVENARRVERLEAENQRLRQEACVEHDMAGTGARMREVYQFIAKVAPADSTVLLCGESGTGKELVARAIHRNSPRAAGPFAAINCATLTETLLESELFGHEKGAFTGAVAMRKGKLEAAAGGTVFLDEIGELPLGLQAKLLRVLQEREFERVGGNRTLKVDVRLIAATNRNLAAGVSAGAFRKDLYYRLNVVPLTLPPLRERREDIAALAAHFAEKHGRRSARGVPGISPQALECLLAYDWPGNVRELENAIEHAIVLGSSELILPEDLPQAVLETERAASAPAGAYQQTVCEEKKRVILNALEQSGGVFTEAAKLLGVHPNYLHRLVRNLNLKSAVRKPMG